MTVPDTWICSALAAEALRHGGWYHRWPDVYQVTPEHLHEALAGGRPGLARDEVRP